jgi:phosphoribosyl 1,2-cyclic phosphate phosphodiesterase
MGVRKMAVERIDKPLNIYFTDKAYEIVDFFRNNTPILKAGVPEMEKEGIIRFHKLEFGREYEIGDIRVIPLKGNHKATWGRTAPTILCACRTEKPSSMAWIPAIIWGNL